MSVFVLVSLACILVAAWFVRPRRVHVIALSKPLAAIMYRRGDSVVVHGKRCRVVSVDHAHNSMMVRET